MSTRAYIVKRRDGYHAVGKAVLENGGTSSTDIGPMTKENAQATRDSLKSMMATWLETKDTSKYIDEMSALRQEVRARERK